MKTICIGGAPSSGTTLLANILDSTPGILCGPESNIFCMDAAYKYDTHFQEQAISCKFPCNSIYSPFTRFFNRKHCHSYGVEQKDVDAAIMSCDSLADFSRWLAEQFSAFRKRDCSAFAEKTPINVGYIGQFLKAFNDGLFIFVIRDGRAVVSSLKRRGFSLIESAMIWMYQTSLAIPWLDHPRVATVKFEDIVANPFMIGAALASQAKVYASAVDIETLYRSNIYREKLERVATWRAHSYLPDQKAAEWIDDNLSSEDLAILTAIKLESVFRPSVFKTISFADLLRTFNYEATLTVEAIKELKLNKELEIYNKTSKNVSCQIVVSLPWLNAQQQRVWREYSELESLDQETIMSFLNLYKQIKPSHSDMDIQCAIAEFSDRFVLPSKRTFRLRKTCVNLLNGGSWRTRTLAHMGDLIEMYLQMFARRAFADQKLTAEDAAELCRALHEYNAYSNRPWSQEQTLLDYAGRVIGGNALKIRQRASGACLNNSEAMMCGKLRNSAAKLLSPSSVVRKDPVATLMRQILMTNQGDERLFEELGGFIDSATGIIYTTQISGTKSSQRRMYVRPGILRFYLALARKNGIAVPESKIAETVPLARETGGAGMGVQQKAGRVIGYGLALRQIPQLSDSYDPVDLDTSRLEFEEQLNSTLDGCFLARPEKRHLQLVLSIRHDVDRPLNKKEFCKIREFEKTYKLRSSWYFKSETFAEEWAESLIKEGAEIGYHASRVEDGDGGFAEHLKNKYPDSIIGCTFHGGFGSTYWRGLSSITAAIKLGYLYTENPADVFAHPYYHRLGSTGIYLTPAPVRLQSHPKHVSKHLKLLVKYRCHIILENHPDRFDKSFKDIVLSVLSSRPTLRTVGEHVNFCKHE
jgi:hypothetical protein